MDRALLKYSSRVCVLYKIVTCWIITYTKMRLGLIPIFHSELVRRHGDKKTPRLSSSIRTIFTNANKKKSDKLTHLTRVEALLPKSVYFIETNIIFCEYTTSLFTHNETK